MWVTYFCSEQHQDFEWRPAGNVSKLWPKFKGGPRMWEHKRMCLSWHQFDLQVCLIFLRFHPTVSPKDSLERDGKLCLQNGHALEPLGFGVSAFPRLRLLFHYTAPHLQLISSPSSGRCCNATVAQAAWMDGWGGQEKKDSCSSKVLLIVLFAVHSYIVTWAMHCAALFSRNQIFSRFADYMKKIKEGTAPGGANQEFVDKTYADWMAGKGASPCSIFNKNYKADCRLIFILWITVFCPGLQPLRPR